MKYTYNEILIKYLAKILNISESDFEVGAGAELANDPADGFVGIMVVDRKNDVEYYGCINHEGYVSIRYFCPNYYQSINNGIELKCYWNKSKQVKKLNQKLKKLGSFYSCSEKIFDYNLGVAR